MMLILCLILHDLIFLSLISAASNIISIDIGSEWMKIAVISVSIQREIKKVVCQKNITHINITYTEGNKILHTLLCNKALQ